jgi:PcfJ-like protein
MPVMIARREFTKGLIDQAVRKAIGSLDRKTRRAFLGLLWKVQARSPMLRPGRFEGRVEADRLDRLVRGLLALTDHRRDWLRPTEAWEPVGTNPFPLFSSLAHHLLATYPVPPVLVSAWLEEPGWFARTHQMWFRRAGQGKSLREVGVPIRLTRRMAWEFARAPAHFSILYALRWAQVRGLGGSDELADAVASSRLAQELRNDEFWVSVLHFFINHPRLDLAHVGPIVDFLQVQKFDQRRVIIGEDTEFFLDPPQPDFSMKGRTVESILRRVAEWRGSKQTNPERRLFQWPRSAINEYRSVEGPEPARCWTIRELLDSDELAAEGKAMHHCVADFTGVCARRSTTIWSLGVEGSGDPGRRRLVTIEVNPATRKILQASMHCNDPPTEEARNILERWAQAAGLTIDD